MSNSLAGIESSGNFSWNSKGEILYRGFSGQRVRPNFRGILSKDHNYAELYTNPLGFRSRLNPGDTAELALIGDEILFAPGLAYRDTIPGILDEHMGEGTRVLNAAAIKVGLQDYKDLLQTVLENYSLKHVVILLSPNDFLSSLMGVQLRTPSLLRFSTVVGASLDWISKVARGFLTSEYEYTQHQKLLERYLELSELLKKEQRLLEDGFSVDRQEVWNKVLINNIHDWSGLWCESVWNEIRKDLMTLKKIAARYDVELVVSLLPVKEQVEFRAEYPQKRLKLVLEQLKIPYLDLFGPLLAVSEQYETFGKMGNLLEPARFEIARQLVTFSKNNTL